MEVTSKINVYLSSNNAYCNSIEFSAQSGDVQSRTIEASIYTTHKSCSNSVPYDCTGKKINIVYEYINEDGSTELSPEYLCDVNNNKIKFIIPNKPLMNTGIVTAQIKIYDLNASSLLNSALFKFEVLRSLGIGDENNINNDIPILIKLIKDVENLDKTLKENENARLQSELVRENKFNEKIKEISDAKDDLNNAITNAERATADATNAANLVPNQILKDATTATQNANEAADRANQAAKNVENANLNIDLSPYVKKTGAEIDASDNTIENYNKASEQRVVSKKVLENKFNLVDTKITQASETIQTSLVPQLANKVDKENGKGLSSNDFTDVYRTQIDENKNDISSLQNRIENMPSSLGRIWEVVIHPYAWNETETDGKYMAYWTDFKDTFDENVILLADLKCDLTNLDEANELIEEYSKLFGIETIRNSQGCLMAIYASSKPSKDLTLQCVEIGSTK